MTLTQATDQKAPKPRRIPVEVSPGFLLEGAFYALEQAGYLLHDARAMCRQKRWASCFALAVLGREEIGRARIYLQRRKAVIGGDTVTIQSLKAEVSGRGAHENKITEAQRITGVFASVHFWGEPPERGTAEDKQVLKRLDEKRRILERERPKEAHQRKLRALYVDPSEDGSYWQRPIAEIAPVEAELMMEEAELQYTFQRRQLLVRTDDTEFESSGRSLALEAHAARSCSIVLL